MNVEIQIAVAKANKYLSNESGDTLEVVERPTGGVSIVLADGRSSGKKAKAISIMVVHRVIGLLAEGVRDDAAAAAVSDQLFSERSGETTVFLNILSVDLLTKTMIMTCNNPSPIYIIRDNRTEFMSGDGTPIGVSHNIRPSIFEIPLEAGTTVVLYTDGLLQAGKQYSQNLDIHTILESLLDEQEPTAQNIADTLLAEAIRLDQGRPNDDMSIVILRVVSGATDQFRRLTVCFPVSLT